MSSINLATCGHASKYMSWLDHYISASVEGMTSPAPLGDRAVPLKALREIVETYMGKPQIQSSCSRIAQKPSSRTDLGNFIRRRKAIATDQSACPIVRTVEKRSPQPLNSAGTAELHSPSHPAKFSPRHLLRPHRLKSRRHLSLLCPRRRPNLRPSLGRYH